MNNDMNNNIFIVTQLKVYFFKKEGDLEFGGLCNWKI